MERWEQFGRSDARRQSDEERRFLRSLVPADLRRRGDPGALFDFLKGSARKLFEHAELISWCEQNGRHREAIQIAQAACREFDDHPVVENLLLAAYERDGWDEEALAIRQRRFTESPCGANYGPLLAAAARAWAYQTVERSPATAARRPTRSRESGERDVSGTVALLLHDGRLAEAHSRVQPPSTCRSDLLEAIAAGLPPRKTRWHSRYSITCCTAS